MVAVMALVLLFAIMNIQVLYIQNQSVQAKNNLRWTNAVPYANRLIAYHEVGFDALLMQGSDTARVSRNTFYLSNSCRHNARHTTRRFTLEAVPQPQSCPE